MSAAAVTSMRRGRSGRRAAALVMGFLGALCATATVAHAQNPPEAVEYYATDALGSVRVVYNSTGQVLGRSDYLPFGETLNQSGALPRQRFTGQERDSEAGLDYFNARDLQTRTGRMNAPDPLFGNAMTSPQRWNRYAYAGNNPLRMVDPSGMDMVDISQMLGLQGFDDFSKDYWFSAWSTWGNYAYWYPVAGGAGGGGGQYSTPAGDSPPDVKKGDFSSLIASQVKEAIAAAVKQSNNPAYNLACLPAGYSGPCQPDVKGKQHETGGTWGADSNQQVVVAPAKPGGLCDDRGCGIYLGNSENPLQRGQFTQAVGGFHVHPAGTSPNGQTYEQGPSGPDLELLGYNINIVVGAGNSQIYLYANSSIVYQMSLKDFLRR
jgi:RHS repeat-associated protein